MHAVSVRDLGKNETVEIPQRFLDLVDKIFDEAHFAREEGEIIASANYPEVGVLQGEVLYANNGFLTPTIGEDVFFSEAFFGLYRLCRLNSATYAGDSLDSPIQQPLPSVDDPDVLKCPKCNSQSVAFESRTKTERSYRCRCCGVVFLDNRLVNLCSKHKRSLVAFAIAYSESHSRDETLAELKRRFGLVINERTLRGWRRMARRRLNPVQANSQNSGLWAGKR
jgi:transposase-like protein